MERQGAKYICYVKQEGNHWTARHESPEVGAVSVTSATRAEAVSTIEGEIRYLVDLCGGSGDRYHVPEIEVVEG